MSGRTTDQPFGAGHLIRGPSSLAPGEAPSYQGTVLGSLTGVEVDIVPVRYQETKEENGGGPARLFHLHWQVTLRAQGWKWHENAVQAQWPAETTTTGDVPTLTISQGNPGEVTSTGVLLFVADRVDTQASFLIYDAHGDALDGGLKWSAYGSRGLMCKFTCREDNSGRVFASGLLSRLSL